MLRKIGYAVLAIGGLTIGYFNLPDDQIPECPDGQYQFIVYPIGLDSAVRAAIPNLGLPRLHPDGTLYLTTKNPNAHLTDEEVMALGVLQDVVLVNSGDIQAYLESNGWNQMEEFPR